MRIYSVTLNPHFTHPIITYILCTHRIFPPKISLVDAVQGFQPSSADSSHPSSILLPLNLPSSLSSYNYI